MNTEIIMKMVENLATVYEFDARRNCAAIEWQATFSAYTALLNKEEAAYMIAKFKELIKK